MSYQYLDINSTYRDRNVWPLPSEFDIPISQTGIKSIQDALDPVSLGSPIFSWTSNNLLIDGASSIGLTTFLGNNFVVSFTK